MEAILDRWLKLVLRSYSEESERFVSAEIDPFRNPVAHILRENLAVLLEYVRRGTEAQPALSALRYILRIHAVQDRTASQSVQFVFQLRPLLRELQENEFNQNFEERIDQLALWAFEEYTNCRERIAELRIKESQRAMGVIAVRRALRSEAGSTV